MAVAALAGAGVHPSGEQWGHAFVQAAFVGQLINRRHLYRREMNDVLTRNRILREVADYGLAHVSEQQAYRALRRTLVFLAAVLGQERRRA